MVSNRPRILPEWFSFRFGLLLVIGVFLVTSCSQMQGTTSQNNDRGEPAWFLDNRPMDPHHIFAAATATASRMQTASSKAATRARGDIAATMETRFQGLTKQFQEEVGEGQNAESLSQFTQAYKSVVNQTINGAKVVEREIKREEGGYRAYVLMRMPMGEAQETLMQQIQMNRDAFSRFRASQAYEELEREVEEHRQRETEREARQQRQETASSDPFDRQTQPDQDQAEPQEDSRLEAEGEQGGDAPGDEAPERDVQEADTRQTEEKPTDEQVQAPAPTQETQSEDQEAPMTEAQQIEARLRSIAEPWMGVPYRFGGESRDGVDCSGLTQALYQEAFDIELPRTTGTQVNRGSPVERSQMRAGDLVFFRTADQQKHVGIYLDDREFVHASSSEGVTVSPLTLNYWQDHYWTARRLSVL